MIFASGQPSREVLTAALALREAVDKSIMSSAWAVHEAIIGTSDASSVVIATRDYEEAVRLAHSLRWAVRGEPAPPAVFPEPRRVPESDLLREEGAAAVEPVREFLIEIMPERLTDEDGENVKAGSWGLMTFSGFWDDWWELRDNLTTFVSSRASRDFRTTARELQEAVERSLVSTEWAVHEAVLGMASVETAEWAKNDHKEAVRLAHSLLWAVLGEPAPPTVFPERRLEGRRMSRPGASVVYVYPDEGVYPDDDADESRRSRSGPRS